MKNRFISLVILLVVILCDFSCSQKKMTIIPLKMLSKSFIDTGTNQNNSLSYKFDLFLMNGYKNNKASVDFVDNFVKKNKDKKSNAYFEYYMWFYKKTDETNIKAINDSIRLTGHYLDHANDLIFVYEWGNYGKFFKREKLDTGKLGPKSKVIIKNIPISADSL